MKQVRCVNFQISRGVFQGDVTSLLFFILALEAILRRHDPVSPGSGLSLADTLVRLLGYADDVAAVEEGDEEGIRRLEGRINGFSKGSAEDADMDINVEKTVMMHVRTQDEVPPQPRKKPRPSKSLSAHT